MEKIQTNKYITQDYIEQQTDLEKGNQTYRKKIDSIKMNKSRYSIDLKVLYSTSRIHPGNLNLINSIAENEHRLQSNIKTLILPIN